MMKHGHNLQGHHVAKRSVNQHRSQRARGKPVQFSSRSETKRTTHPPAWQVHGELKWPTRAERGERVKVARLQLGFPRVKAEAGQRGCHPAGRGSPSSPAPSVQVQLKKIPRAAGRRPITEGQGYFGQKKKNRVLITFPPPTPHPTLGTGGWVGGAPSHLPLNDTWSRKYRSLRAEASA